MYVSDTNTSKELGKIMFSAVTYEFSTKYFTNVPVTIKNPVGLQVVY